jgi:hypothetical protein
MNDPLTALIAAHPELDPDHLTDAWSVMDSIEADRPRPYGKAEQDAHQLLITYLRHMGEADRDGRSDGELSDRSREELTRRLGLGAANIDETQPVCVLPVEVVQELFADFIGLVNANYGAAQEWLRERVRRRTAQDVARKAWERASGAEWLLPAAVADEGDACFRCCPDKATSR